MYYRRKIVLALLETFGGTLSAKSLQKYLFLFTRLQSKRSYDFIPYKYGCFSFQANQDIYTMEKYGYLKVEESERGRLICLQQTSSYRDAIELADKQALTSVRAEFGSLSQDELIAFTYRNFPYFAIRSAIADKLMTADELANIAKQERHFSEPMLFSIGYEGLNLETYINRLIVSDVRVLCDVRKNAFSQKYGFSKKQMQMACEGVGIQYVHVPDLGIESNQRHDLNNQSDYDRLFDSYEQTTLKNNRNALLQLRALLDSKKRIAVTCFEKDSAQCHRTRVATALMNLPDRTYDLRNL